MDASPESGHRRKSPARQITLAALAFLAIIAVVAAAAYTAQVILSNRQGEAERQRVLQRFEDAGIPTRAVPDYALGESESEPSPAREAAALYRAAFALSGVFRARLSRDQRATLPFFRVGDVSPPPLGMPIDDALGRRIRAAVELHADVLDLADRARAIGEVAVIRSSSGDGFGSSTLSYTLEPLARFYRLRSVMHQWAGEADEALEAATALLDLVRLVQPEPESSLAILQDGHTVTQFTDSLEQVLSRTQPSAERLAELPPMILAMEPRFEPSRYLRIEAANAGRLLDAPEREALRRLHVLAKFAEEGFMPGQTIGPDMRFRFSAEGLSDEPIDARPEVRRILRGYVIDPGHFKLYLASEADGMLDPYEASVGMSLPEIAERARGAYLEDPASEVDNDLERLRADAVNVGWGSAGAPIDATARLRIAATAIEAELFHREHGRWPGSLAELAGTADGEPLPDRMIDPNTGDPLRYRPTEHGVAIDSVLAGHGRGNLSAEINFHLIDPPKRNRIDPPADE